MIEMLTDLDVVHVVCDVCRSKERAKRTRELTRGLAVCTHTLPEGWVRVTPRPPNEVAVSVAGHMSSLAVDLCSECYEVYRG